jgi:uncharacterized damage-inducible protein DinB
MEERPAAERRVAPPYVAGEREMLVSWLDWHRETLAVKCAGLPEARLRERVAAPSTLSLLGLVRHMADVERAWFRRTLAGEDAPPLYYGPDDPDGEFDNVDSASAGEAFAAWRAEVEHARAIVAAQPSLEVTGFNKRSGATVSLRWILVHMIEEYARHNGHADILRERLDGSTGV